MLLQLKVKNQFQVFIVFAMGLCFGHKNARSKQGMALGRAHLHRHPSCSRPPRRRPSAHDRAEAGGEGCQVLGNTCFGRSCDVQRVRVPTPGPRRRARRRARRCRPNHRLSRRCCQCTRRRVPTRRAACPRRLAPRPNTASVREEDRTRRAPSHATARGAARRQPIVRRMQTSCATCSRSQRLRARTTSQCAA